MVLTLGSFRSIAFMDGWDGRIRALIFVLFTLKHFFLSRSESSNLTLHRSEPGRIQLRTAAKNPKYLPPEGVISCTRGSD